MIVLQSLSTFLRCALSETPPSSPRDSIRPPTIASRAWYLCPSFSSPDAFDIFLELLVPSSQKTIRTPCRLWETEPDSTILDHMFAHRFHLSKEPLESPWTLQQLSDVVTVQGGLTNADHGSHTDSNFIAVGLALRIHQIVLNAYSVWLAPSIRT
jgi:pre-rRNA-processing protein IPI1